MKRPRGISVVGVGGVAGLSVVSFGRGDRGRGYERSQFIGGGEIDLSEVTLNILSWGLSLVVEGRLISILSAGPSTRVRGGPGCVFVESE